MLIHYTYLVIGSASSKTPNIHSQGISCDKVRGLFMRCSNLKPRVRDSRTRINGDDRNSISRRDLIELVLGVSSLFLDSYEAKGAGLPPEEKRRLCDAACEKELENVWQYYFTLYLQYFFLVVESF